MAFAGRVVLFTIPGCKFCRQAKTLLGDYHVPYFDVDLSKYPERRYEMKERTGRSSVPQIFFNNRHIGGWDDIKALHDEDKLVLLIEETAEEEPPPDAPLPPPEIDSPPEEDGEVVLLPSQRDSGGKRDCTPDELAALCKEIQDSSLVKTHTYHLISYKNSFVGRELVEWLMHRKSMRREEALSLGKDLMKRHFIHHVTYEHDFEDEYLFYRMLDDVKTRSLNAALSSHCLPRKAVDIADDLRKLILEIYDEHLSPDGFAVDYKGISTSPKFEEYVRATAELKRADIVNLWRQEKLALFINVYNALVIHAFVVQGPPTSTFRRLMFFNKTSYVIGGQEFSLNDIESGILRANRRPVATFKRPFSRHDPRLPIALDEVEPRIHFALVCGAKSCPPIKTYTAANIDEELKFSTEAFLESDNVMVDLTRREVTLSMILKWYKVDFGSNNQQVLEWIYAHMPDSEKRRSLKSLIDSGNYRMKYFKYNWDVNSS
ncbi:PREDICTED: uncharacterized protein LOC100634227 isoform X2 [Amphimedon queenslandica]|uniref:DEP domain-containing protein n=1 Tax=Amphimedon queenslandica TaxID=400682 RepID=A0AAN0J0F7_AMPQE|nr:PREDICTED: uncharacterized protein LOC100634227 isoform X2 [Amphimedon queenslandica]|eukprot:XP_019850198.1 PREDICTED: uncharacterized protein LOC100634227 isoform X2 [Amphimedon queenslandica]